MILYDFTDFAYIVLSLGELRPNHPGEPLGPATWRHSFMESENPLRQAWLGKNWKLYAVCVPGRTALARVPAPRTKSQLIRAHAGVGDKGMSHCLLLAYF